MLKLWLRSKVSYRSHIYDCVAFYSVWSKYSSVFILGEGINKLTWHAVVSNYYMNACNILNRLDAFYVFWDSHGMKIRGDSQYSYSNSAVTIRRWTDLNKICNRDPLIFEQEHRNRRQNLVFLYEQTLKKLNDKVHEYY